MQNAVDQPAAAPTELRLATWPLWATWLVGPASFGAAFVYCATFTDRSIDRTRLLIVCGLVLTHVAAGLMTIALAFVPACVPQRSSGR